MATDLPALDPRLEEVLRDIAADPRARLFTCDVERMVRGLGSAPVHASVSTAGLTSAERQLLTIGRDEVARLFLIAFRERLEAEQDGSFVYTHERMSPAAWEARARTAQSRGFAGREERVRLARPVQSAQAMTTGELLAACIHKDEARSIDRADLLAASQRLADRPTTRVYTGIEFVMRGRYAAARSILTAVLREHSTPIVSHYAHVWSAILSGATGDSNGAAAQFVTASRTPNSRGDLTQSIRLSLLSALWFFAKARDMTKIRLLGDICNASPGEAQLDAQFLRHHIALGERIHLGRNTGATAQDRELALFVESLDGIAKEIVYAALS